MSEDKKNDLSQLPFTPAYIERALFDTHSPIKKENDKQQWWDEIFEKLLHVHSMQLDQMVYDEKTKAKEALHEEMKNRARSEEYQNKTLLILELQKERKAMDEQLRQISRADSLDVLAAREKTLNDMLKQCDSQLDRLQATQDKINEQKKENTTEWRKTVTSEYQENAKKATFTKLTPAKVSEELVNIINKTASPVKIVDIVAKSYAMAEKQQGEENKAIPAPPPLPPAMLNGNVMAKKANLNLELNFISQCLAKGGTGPDILASIKQEKSGLKTVFNVGHACQEKQAAMFDEAISLVRQGAVCDYYKQMVNSHVKDIKQGLAQIQDRKEELMPSSPSPSRRG